MTRLLLVLAGLAVIGCDSEAEGLVIGEVAGVVRDGATGAPIADAAVRLQWVRPPEPGQALATVSTDDTGRYLYAFQVTGSCAAFGALTITVRAPGYEPAEPIEASCAGEIVDAVRDVDLAPR